VLNFAAMLVYVTACTEARLEVRMRTPRREIRGGRAFAGPVLGIVILLACYYLLVGWHQMPAIIDFALAMVN
jgi:hypothetical protein